MDMKKLASDVDDYKAAQDVMTDVRDSVVEYSVEALAKFKDIEAAHQKASEQAVKDMQEVLAPLDGIDFDHPNMQSLLMSIQQKKSDVQQAIGAQTRFDIRLNTHEAEQAAAVMAALHLPGA